MLKIDWKRHELQHPGVLQCELARVKSYPTVRLGAPARLKKLHSKIGRRVDLARVTYGTMQSERRRLPTAGSESAPAIEPARRFSDVSHD